MGLRCAPPTIACLISPVRRLWQAVCKAASLEAEEQAVSIVTLGPWRSKKYEIRFANSDSAHPMKCSLGVVIGSLRHCSS